MRFDFIHVFTASTPFLHEAQTRSAGASFLQHFMQSHGASSMRFDFIQLFTASTPFLHEAQTRSAGASFHQHFMQSHAPSVNRDARMLPASAPAIPQWAQSPFVAAICEGL